MLPSFRYGTNVPGVPAGPRGRITAQGDQQDDRALHRVTWTKPAVSRPVLRTPQRCGAVLALALLCGACSTVRAAPAAAASSQQAVADGQVTGNQYVIGPGDILSIFVYEAPPLSVTELPVRPDGRISVPLVPDVVAAGKTPTQLGADISPQA